MNPTSFQQLVDQVRERTEISALVAETVALERAGSVLKGRSPWEADQTPSLVVWTQTQTWRDFSGGGSGGGDCFDWMRKRDGLDFMGALRRLAARAGVTLPGESEGQSQAELAALAERRRVTALLTAAAAYYHQVLPAELRQTAFREHYGFTDATIDELQLGWSDGQGLRR